MELILIQYENSKLDSLFIIFELRVINLFRFWAKAGKASNIAHVGKINYHIMNQFSGTVKFSE